jgi:hypothetical protein
LSGEVLGMVDRRWSANGGAAEASPEFAMVLAQCTDKSRNTVSPTTKPRELKDNGHPVRARQRL